MKLSYLKVCEEHAFRGWVALKDRSVGLDLTDQAICMDGLCPRMADVLAAIAVAPALDSVHVLRPREAVARAYDVRVFPTTAPVIQGARPPAGHKHPVMNTDVLEFASHCPANVTAEPVVNWAVCILSGDTRVWFYQPVVDGARFDLVVQMGYCYEAHTFCAELLAKVLGIEM